MADKFSETKILIIGFLIAIISYFSFLLSINFFVILGIILLAFSLASIDGIKMVYIGKNVSPEYLATSQGTLNALYGFGQLFGGSFAGYLWTKFGFTYSFIIGIILMSISLLILLKSLKSNA